MAVGYVLIRKGTTALSGTSVAPTRAIENVKEDVKWTTRQGA